MTMSNSFINFNRADGYLNESGTRKWVRRYELVQGETDGVHKEDGDGAKFSAYSFLPINRLQSDWMFSWPSQPSFNRNKKYSTKSRPSCWTIAKCRLRSIASHHLWCRICSQHVKVSPSVRRFAFIGDVGRIWRRRSKYRDLGITEYDGAAVTRAGRRTQDKWRCGRGREVGRCWRCRWGQRWEERCGRW